jgi:hypothetical protein
MEWVIRSSKRDGRSTIEERRARFREDVVVSSEVMDAEEGEDEVRVRRARLRRTLYRPEDFRAFGGIIGEEYPEDGLRYDVPAIARSPEEKNSE